MSNIEGNPETGDLETAQKLIAPGETILAIYRAGPDNAKNATLQPFACLACPCFWPHAIVCCPCIVAGFLNAKAYFEGTMHIVTDKSLYRHTDTAPPCPCLPTTGRESGSQPLADITSFGSDMPGAACGKQCCPTTKIVLGVGQGSVLANCGGSKHVPSSQCMILLPNPEEALAFIRNAKEQAPGQQAMGHSFAMPATVVGAPAQDATQKILGLKQMLDAGAITQEEFDDKKKEIMDRM